MTKSLIPHLTSRKNVARAMKTSLIVGPILTLINQTPSLVRVLNREAVEPIVFLRILLTFIVPFVVSLVSAALADRARAGE